MNQTLSILAVVLLAVLVGAAVPVLVQLHQTLRRAREFMDSTGRRADRALDEVTDTTARIGRLASELEGGAGNLRVLTEALGGIGRSIGEAQEAFHVVVAAGRAVAPAVTAAARVLFARSRDEEGQADRPDGTAADRAGAEPPGTATAAEPRGDDNGKDRHDLKGKEVASNAR